MCPFGAEGPLEAVVGSSNTAHIVRGERGANRPGADRQAGAVCQAEGDAERTGERDIGR
jgi:hypothetical protein